MDQATADAIKDIASQETWTYKDYQTLISRLAELRDPAGRARELLAELESKTPEPKGTDAVKIGIARFMLCRFEQALQTFTNATDNKDRRYFAAECLRCLQRFDEAIEDYERAKARGWDSPEADTRRVQCFALAGRLDDAAEALKDLGKDVAESADGWYLKGLLAELNGEDSQTVLEAYEQACELDEDHAEATFRMAFYLDLHGEEEEAIDLYKDCLGRPPVYANALMNLAVLHEDAGQYDQAIAYLNRVLAVNPNHARARLFMRDAQASKSMHYDEDQARRIAKRNAVLDIPVTDFELSVRARNCLKKMNIRSLGDLVRTTESELLGYKNFGETSLKEIKDMLAAKGLRLGQALEEGTDFSASPDEPLGIVTLEENGVRSTLIDQVEFSVRARRVLDQLGIRTIGDLADRSEAELLAQKNFGQTSLNEMRQRLTDHNLSFRDSS
ncbi:MAG: tetratricopeptide repeat protein [Planctomycetes bacterium]|jgi:DNA-directed RNA polymerase subunit alpha|nr:tetratricopeptide repeat protein [Phycisphaerae bacterium]NBB95524.1 tetratricopeptide repeat protein [Planctomycetota bacterium]